MQKDRSAVCGAVFFTKQQTLFLSANEQSKHITKSRFWVGNDGRIAHGELM